MSENNKNFMEALAKEIEDKNSESKDVKPKLEDIKKSDDGSPNSFEKETFTRIEKNKISFNPKILGGILVVLLLVVIASYFLFFAPKIKMPDFIGKDINEFTSWATQYEIDRTGVVVSKEYNFEYDKDVIIKQSITPDTKIKKDTKISIVTSDGPDPDELVTFPDIKNMTMDEIQDWIKENKLLKTKVVTEYSTTVEKDMVIKFDLKNISENNFTRGTNLNITVSKGEAPAGQVTIEDFTNKSFEEMKTWASSKKVNLEKTEAYSDTVAVGNVISQDVKSGTAIKQNETIKVIVSKGKAVKIPNLVGYTPTMLEAWSAAPDSKVTIVKKEVYNEAPYGNVIAQSIPPNSAVDQGEVLELTVSLYLPVLQTSSDEWYGLNYMELIAKVDEWNYKGANIHAGPWIQGEYSDTVKKGGILEYVCADVNGNELPGNSQYSRGCERPLPLDAKIGMKVSLGKIEEVEPTVIPTVAKPEVINSDEIYQSNITVFIKTTPGATVTITASNNANEFGTANEVGTAIINIDLSNANYMKIESKLSGYITSYSDMPIPKKKP